ncbi:hypothetical protein ACU61A_22130 [Pseudonocardia sichuanensis]
MTNDEPRHDPALVTSEDLRRASALLAHHCRRDRAGVNGVLADVGDRSTPLLLALLLLVERAVPGFTSDETAAVWERSAAVFAVDAAARG